MKEKIAIIINSSLDIRKLNSWESKIYSFEGPAPYIKHRIFDKLEDYDYDIFMQLNYNGEMNEHIEHQIKFLTETYNPKRLKIIKTEDLEQEIEDNIDWHIKPIVKADRFYKHFPQHYGFFNECRDLINENYDYFFKLRPDVYPQFYFSLAEAIQRYEPIGPKENRLWTSDCFIVNNKHRPIHCKDIVLIYDKKLMENCLRVLNDWMYECYFEIEMMRKMIWPREGNDPYINVEGALGKLIQMTNANVTVHQNYCGHALYRDTHLVLKNEKIDNPFSKDMNHRIGMLSYKWFQQEQVWQEE